MVRSLLLTVAKRRLRTCIFQQNEVCVLFNIQLCALLLSQQLQSKLKCSCLSVNFARTLSYYHYVLSVAAGRLNRDGKGDDIKSKVAIQII